MPHTTRRNRRGAAMVEGAIVLSVCALLLGMLELSLMLVNHTMMSEGARRVARAAIVRGDRCGSMGEWGPAQLTINANDSHAAAAVLREVLFTLPPADAQIQITWLDADNSAGDRVRVNVNHTHRPIVPVWGWNTGLVLSGTSTMQIMH
ncbi:hypothetical protein ETAA8_68090 [Anatilimnocola aggregata]|uniref:TadE-like domain-containing protein n=1 Tax=Anatilimnocola aggregata TaxID=2528021 RepID=A0A517YN57_9BACT|nr:TadE/TadG family type IV pilus assembly protein [Anatilimnocola aggregata]QDU31649.1 hypothetical protein ETAA8_68090 [Anatilimnocola aggregata]